MVLYLGEMGRKLWTPVIKVFTSGCSPNGIPDSNTTTDDSAERAVATAL